MYKTGRNTRPSFLRIKSTTFENKENNTWLLNWVRKHYVINGLSFFFFFLSNNTLTQTKERERDSNCEHFYAHWIKYLMGEKETDFDANKSKKGINIKFYEPNMPSKFIYICVCVCVWGIKILIRHLRQVSYLWPRSPLPSQGGYTLVQ